MQEVKRDYKVGITSAEPFISALYAYTAHLSKTSAEKPASLAFEHLTGKGGTSSVGSSKLFRHAHKRSKEDKEREIPVHPVKSLAREIKMLSMNPSIYGNVYGVLGNS
jgi:hypothetical protein